MFGTMKWVGVAAVTSFLAIAGSTQAAVIETCGNKGFSATQDGMDLSYTDTHLGETGICGNQGGSLGNSTGANSLISAAGWINGSEVSGGSQEPGSPPSGGGDGNLTLIIDVQNKTWSILNPNNYSKVGLSLKHGNGYIFYVLDPLKSLDGFWSTYNNGRASADFSHHNAWYKTGDGGGGNPPVVPLPATVWMMIAGLGGLGAMRRFRKA